MDIDVEVEVDVDIDIAILRYTPPSLVSGLVSVSLQPFSSNSIGSSWAAGSTTTRWGIPMEKENHTCNIYTQTYCVYVYISHI